jgi:hypothetical protein
LQGDAAGRLPVIQGQQQAPGRRGVPAWKPGQFLLEILKAEAEAQ